MQAKHCYALAVAVTSAALVSPAAAELKKVPYAPVTVQLEEAYKPDAAFDKFRKAFIDATSKKDTAALSALVAPGFVWTSDGALSNDYDPGRSALHNFKVVFGFRAFGKDLDGGVDGGPFWDDLTAFAGDDAFYKLDQGNGMVCGPMAASVQDEDKLEQARKKIESGDDVADWYFVLRDTKVMKAPDDKGLPVGSINGQAFPVLSTAPAARAGQPAPQPTHYEILLPNGKSGWIPVSAARPLDSSRLCFTQTAKRDWAIGLYDALANDDNADDDDNGNAK